MRIDLPSGGWVEIKDAYTPGDRYAIRDAPDVSNVDGQVVVTNAEGNSWKAFYMKAITAWSFPAPVPGVGGPQVIDEFLTLDDLDELEQQCRPVYEKVAGRPNSRRNSKPQQSSGTTPGS